jgi:hypothetical protein
MPCPATYQANPPYGDCFAARPRSQEGARIHTWTFTNLTGAEFSDPTRAATTTSTPYHSPHPALRTIDLKPDEIAAFLASHLIASTDLFTLADLRWRGQMVVATPG